MKHLVSRPRRCASRRLGLAALGIASALLGGCANHSDIAFADQCGDIMQQAVFGDALAGAPVAQTAITPAQFMGVRNRVPPLIPAARRLVIECRGGSPVLLSALP
jgi:hypothetical protein